MNYFPIRNCPLCSKKLLIGDEDSVHTYYCKEFYLRYVSYSSANAVDYTKQYRGGKFEEPHYSVTISDRVWRQSTMIPPYWIISDSASNKSKIYKFSKEYKEPSEEELLMEVPIISPNDYLAENFARKIKNLVIFT